ncbi:hypothetical protein A2U01_0052157, partial [Trifolium medium]|nr:hypothetical protein [Trifolium medium]
MLARQLNFKAVELNVDCIVVVKAISSSCSGIMSGKSIADKIRRILQLDWEVVLKMFFYDDVCPSAPSHLIAADALNPLG